MPVKITIEDALRRAIQTEKNAMDFYRRGAHYMQDPGAKKVFELLAREEREHAETFYRVYPGQEIGNFQAFMDVDPAVKSGWLADLGMELAELDERKAMLVALDKEQKLEQSAVAAGDGRPDRGPRGAGRLRGERPLHPSSLPADRVGIRPPDGDGARE